MKRTAGDELTFQDELIIRNDTAVTADEKVQSEQAVYARRDFPRTISIEGLQKPSKKLKHNDGKASSTESLSSTDSSATATTAKRAQNPFAGKYTNILSESNSTVLFATDEWFARAENLIKDADPVFDPDLYCSEGKVMDGWESRRKRTEGHDWCVIATKSKCQAYEQKVNDVVGIEVDTAYFTGNQAPRISIQVANCSPKDGEKAEEEWMYTWMPNAISRIANNGGIQGTGQTLKQIERANKACEQFEWKEVLPMTPLQPGYEETRMHYFKVDESIRNEVKGFTHVRINYFPDGGVARLRLWGELSSENEVDSNSDEQNDYMIGPGTDDGPPSSFPYPYPELSLSSNGGVGLSCSNKHYGVPENLIQPTYGKDMGDGWETARHPNRPPVLIKDPKTNLIDNPLMDWAIIKLGMGGSRKDGIHRIIIDTKHFKGNFPESVMIEGFNANATSFSDDDIVRLSNEDRTDGSICIKWFPLLSRAKMGADSEHVFEKKYGQLINCDRAVTHVRVSIFPDGGVSRVRVYGQPANM